MDGRIAKRKLLWLGIVAAVTLGVLSCADPPHDQIRKTRSALSEVRDLVKADQWAPTEMASAQVAMDGAEKELAAQNRRFGILRDYVKASELFRQAAGEIELARQAALRSKAEAEKSAREALDAAGSAIGHAQATLMIAPVSRDDRASIDRIETDLGRAQSRLAEVRRLIVDEKYKEATRMAEEILDQVSNLIRAARRAARR